MRAIYLVFSFAVILLATAALAEPNKEQYELQERCGQAAAKRFKNDWGNGVINSEGSQDVATYQNHYSSTLNKCFYLEIVNSIPSKIGTQRTSTYHMGLLDLNENKEWARFFQSAGEMEPIFCHVRQTICHSQDEWMTLIKPFMGD